MGETMLKRSIVVVGAVVLLVGSALAEAQTRGQGQRGQRPGGQGFGGPGGGGVTSLLASPEVQKELGVNEEQKGLIEDMLKDLRQSRENAGGGNRQDLQNLSQEERQKRFEEFRKQAEEREKKAEEMARMVLEPKQVDRLNQLGLQREGPSALARPEFADKVGLSAEQKEKIAKIREAARPDRGGATRNRGDGSQEERQKAFAEAREAREKTNQEMLAVLTVKQKEVWEQMQGKKFDFPQPQGRRPRGN
jgi:hypothetical protein